MTLHQDPTGAEPKNAPEPQEPNTPPEPQEPQGVSGADEIARLQKQGEENLKRATVAEESLAQAKTELAAARMEAAKLRIHAAYPQISGNALDTLAPADADPDKLEEWAKAYAAELAKIQPDQPEPAHRTPGSIADDIRGFGMPKPPSHVQGDAETGYAYGRKFAAINTEK